MRRGSTESGIFHILRECAGVLQCPACDYCQRPVVSRMKKPSEEESVDEDDVDLVCQGLCFEQEKRIRLTYVRCDCTVDYKSNGNGVLTVSHVGEHGHRRPPVVHATGAALAAYDAVAEAGVRMPPKKKAPQVLPPVSGPMPISTLCGSGKCVRVPIIAAIS